MGHLPVLLGESIDALNIKPDGAYVDGTLGRGGHALEIAKRLEAGMLVAIDRDSEAVSEAALRLAGHTDKIRLVHGNFRDLASILDSLGIGAADGMLFDLGASSPQLDDKERGFSYMGDALLDMRMDRGEGPTAMDLVNTLPEEKLRSIFYEYGEERHAGRIAREIAKTRESRQIRTTFELNGIIASAMPAAARREPQHPSKRCYQALRIMVNDELGAIAEMLETAPGRLKPGGRLCVISFHSLEDRLVKNSFNSLARGCNCPKGFPVCVCGFVPSIKIISKKPVVPSDGERDRNPRARSAKLRVAERL